MVSEDNSNESTSQTTSSFSNLCLDDSEQIIDDETATSGDCLYRHNNESQETKKKLCRNKSLDGINEIE